MSQKQETEGKVLYMIPYPHPNRPLEQEHGIIIEEFTKSLLASFARCDEKMRV